MLTLTGTESQQKEPLCFSQRLVLGGRRSLSSALVADCLQTPAAPTRQPCRNQLKVQEHPKHLQEPTIMIIILSAQSFENKHLDPI